MKAFSVEVDIVFPQIHDPSYHPRAARKKSAATNASLVVSTTTSANTRVGRIVNLEGGKGHKNAHGDASYHAHMTQVVRSALVVGP